MTAHKPDKQIDLPAMAPLPGLDAKRFLPLTATTPKSPKTVGKRKIGRTANHRIPYFPKHFPKYPTTTQ
jgi:hypothetical protein